MRAGGRQRLAKWSTVHSTVVRVPMSAFGTSRKYRPQHSATAKTPEADTGRGCFVGGRGEVGAHDLCLGGPVVPFSRLPLWHAISATWIGACQ
jgi:hypothetical protein